MSEATIREGLVHCIEQHQVARYARPVSPLLALEDLAVLPALFLPVPPSPAPALIFSAMNDPMLFSTARSMLPSRLTKDSHFDVTPNFMTFSAAFGPRSLKLRSRPSNPTCEKQ